MNIKMKEVLSNIIIMYKAFFDSDLSIPGIFDIDRSKGKLK